MDSDMNDMVSPSQSSPSTMGNASQKANSGGENTAIVKEFSEVFLFTFIENCLFQLLTKPRLQELVREVDANEQLDGELKFDSDLALKLGTFLELSWNFQRRSRTACCKLPMNLWKM
jgi:hypothetical protein